MIRPEIPMWDWFDAAATCASKGVEIPAAFQSKIERVKAACGAGTPSGAAPPISAPPVAPPAPTIAT